MRIFWLIFFFMCPFIATFGQVEEKAKDNSKPTNLYNQLDNFLEYVHTPDFNTFGYNPKFTLAPSESFSVVVEIPFRYHSGTQKFGMADPRFRTFWVPYKNYDNFFGSFGASLDIYAPIGKYENGLGSSSWRFSPGLIVGLMLNKSQTISIFPNLSYIYTTKPTSDFIPEYLKEIDHGINFQVISSFVFGGDAFVLITPIVDIKDLKDEREDNFILEVEPVIDIMQDKFQIGMFYRGAFNTKEHTLSLNFTVFL